MKTSRIRITPIETWIREKAGIAREVTGGSFVNALEAYQLRRLNETLDYARRNTVFYRRHLADLAAAPLSEMSGIAGIPFTTASDIAENPFAFLAVRLDHVARIVTLSTSGTTGKSKRLFFTERDLGLTVDFFHHGMSTLVGPGQRVMVFLPGERPDSVGDLLLRGLERMDVRAVAYGPVANPFHAAEAVASFGAHCIVGIPTQVLAVACSRAGAAIGKGRIESVLLSTDYVPRAIAHRLEEIWGCRVFNHYGMTEMGLGGGVECEALDGYHLREGDLYFEVVDHESGEVCPEGGVGEVVFTTLTRRGMPLIRYRTGDIARMHTLPCPCGSVLRRMDHVKGRWTGDLPLGSNCTLRLSDTDEKLFRMKGMLDYRVTVSRGPDGKLRLHFDVHRAPGENPTADEVLREVTEVPSVREGIATAKLEIPTVRFSPEGRWTTTGVSKRRIVTASELQAVGSYPASS